MKMNICNKQVCLCLLLITTLCMCGCNSCRDVQVPYDEQEAYSKTEYYTETVPYTDRECQDVTLVYKVEMVTCQDKQGGILGIGYQPAKEVFTITNLDNEGGNFKMDLGFKMGGQNLGGTSLTEYIYPQSSQTFSYEFDTRMEQCSYKVYAPTKQVCRDVIKYREIQKSRQVTAYKPVTKYRTERQC